MMNLLLAPPQRKEVEAMDCVTALVVAVVADLISFYIRKWLDGNQ